MTVSPGKQYLRRADLALIAARTDDRCLCGGGLAVGWYLTSTTRHNRVVKVTGSLMVGEWVGYKAALRRRTQLQ